MINVWVGVAAMSGIATECAGRRLGCVVVVSEFHYFDCIIILLLFYLVFLIEVNYLLTTYENFKCKF